MVAPRNPPPPLGRRTRSAQPYIYIYVTYLGNSTYRASVSAKSYISNDLPPTNCGYPTRTNRVNFGHRQHQGWCGQTYTLDP